ncbi:MAG: hypothetical protein B6242_08765 [Anaerolineaceae bacterium 4572_78]|nr:MAG: hypothetical protein B6242_08765 [Anaerolineaceae bacterium 4572_78]
MKKRLFLIIVILILNSLLVQSQFSGDVDITFTTSQNELTVGDNISLQLNITHPPNYKIVIPELQKTWGLFEVISQSEIETVTHDDGNQTTSQNITITIFDVGTFQTPTLQITIQDPSGEVAERAVPQINLTVASVLAADDAELRDIKPQATLPLPPRWPWIVGGLALLLIILIIARWLYNRWKRRPEKVTVPQPIIDTRPAYVIAYEELARIEQMDLIGQGRFKEYYTLTTDCLRGYLQRRLDFPAMDLTTHEIKRMFRESDISTENTRLWYYFFSNSDLVKFARLIPDIEKSENLIYEARRRIEIIENDLRPHEVKL